MENTILVHLEATHVKAYKVHKNGAQLENKFHNHGHNIL